MEKNHAKSALKLVKSGSQSAVQWSSANGGMASPKHRAKENTKPQDFKLHTQERAVKRAMYNYSVATKLYLTELQKRQEKRVLKMIEEEEIKLLRKELIPRAQLMPIFDRPFFPQRSNRSSRVGRESCFHMLTGKCWSCSCSRLYSFQQNEAH